jgi:hypothetical protein
MLQPIFAQNVSQSWSLPALVFATALAGTRAAAAAG